MPQLLSDCSAQNYPRQQVEHALLGGHDSLQLTLLHGEKSERAAQDVLLVLERLTSRREAALHLAPNERV